MAGRRGAIGDVGAGGAPLVPPVSATVADAALGLAAVDLGGVAELLAMLGNRVAPIFRHPQALFNGARPARPHARMMISYD